MNDGSWTGSARQENLREIAIRNFNRYLPDDPPGLLKCLQDANKRHCAPMMPNDSLLAIVRSVLKDAGRHNFIKASGQKEQRRDDLNETANLTLKEAEARSFSRKLSLATGSRGDILSVPENYIQILDQDAYLGGKLRYNALTGRPEIRGVFWGVELHPVRDEDLFQIRRFMSEVYGLRNKDEIRQAIEIVSRENRYHPVSEYLDSLRWDGEKRIGNLFPHYLGAERSDYTEAVTLMLLHGAIQRVCNPGVKFDCCVILADSRQGTGKSTMCRLLALNDKWFGDELGDLSDNKKAYEMIRGHWIVELSEMLATRRTKDVEAIKSFITRTSDCYRQPYGTYAEEYPRQCVFIGTSNKPAFLPEDRTGNRRFYPILCDGSKAKEHILLNEAESRRYIEQCYAEAVAIGKKSGWTLTLDRRFDSELELMREQSTPEDSRVGMIQEWLEHSGKSIVCSRMVWDQLFSDGYTQPTQAELNAISEILTLNVKGWEKMEKKFRFTDIGNSQKPYGVQRAWKRI